MSRRSRAREVVMQLLYRDDLNGRSSEALDNQFLAKRLNGNKGLIEFADTILQGVRQHLDSIDQLLNEVAKNWRLERMAATDRNALRIAAWEILHGDTPARVAINEAIEMSKRYGDAESSRFVNGVLDRLMQDQETDADSPDNENPVNVESTDGDTPDEASDPKDNSANVG